MSTATLGRIEPAELARRLSLPDAPVLLDVREPEELEIACLPDIVHVPLGEIFRRAEDLDPDAEYVVICHHGIRSAQAGGYLVGQGFSRVLNLVGGMEAWAVLIDSDMPRY